MRILIACEESQRVCKEFRKRGHEAYSCDLLPCGGGHPEWHIMGDCLPLINGNCEFITMDGQTHKIDGNWDLLIAHPPCTYLTNGGAVRMFRREIKEYPPYGTFQMVNVERLKQGMIARDFFMSFMNADCDRIAIVSGGKIAGILPHRRVFLRRRKRHDLLQLHAVPER